MESSVTSLSCHKIFHILIRFKDRSNFKTCKIPRLISNYNRWRWRGNRGSVCRLVEYTGRSVLPLEHPSRWQLPAPRGWPQSNPAPWPDPCDCLKSTYKLLLGWRLPFPLNLRSRPRRRKEWIENDQIRLMDNRLMMTWEGLTVLDFRRHF